MPAFNKGSGVNGRNSDFGLTKFISAASSGDIGTMENIVEKYRAKPASYYILRQPKHDVTALLVASGNGHIEPVEYILDLAEKNNVNDATEERSGTSTYNNETALFWAVHNGHYDVVKALVNGGADVFAEVRGQLPVDYARRQKHDSIAKYLTGVMNAQRPPRRGGSRRVKKSKKTRKSKARRHTRRA